MRRVTVSALACAASLIGSTVASASFPGTNGLIAFSQGDLLPGGDLSAHSQVFTIESDGSNLTQLTDVAGDQAAGSPEFSPDGERIVYQSNESGAFHIWVMAADGTSQEQLTDEEGFEDFQPSWSPDGERIVFSHCGEPFGFIAYCDIAAMEADGSGVESLLGGRWTHSRPSYSPDGSRIAFSSDKGGLQSAIWVTNADGSDPERLTKPKLRAFWPDWAPDGRRILFSDNCCIPSASLWTVHPGGGGLRQLTHVQGDEVFASYSPSGRKIVTLFFSAETENAPLHTLRGDGTHLRQVPTDTPNTFLSDWGPGG
jgi:Tol biopolymer transport system component